MVTGPANPSFPPLNTLAPPDRVATPGLPLKNRRFCLDYGDETTEEAPSSQVHEIISGNNSLPAVLQGDVLQTKVLHTQVRNFRGSKDKFNEFQHLLLSYLRPHQHKIREEKEHYTTSKASRDMKPLTSGIS